MRLVGSGTGTGTGAGMTTASGRGLPPPARLHPGVLRSIMVGTGPPPPPPRKREGDGEAPRVALACQKPPDDRGRWPLPLLADRRVEWAYVDPISYQTVRRTLKKTNSNLGGASRGAFRPKPTRSLSGRGRRCWQCTSGRRTPSVRWCAWRRPASNGSARSARRSRRLPGRWLTRTVSMFATAWPISS